METASIEFVPSKRTPFSAVYAALGWNYKVQGYSGRDSTLNGMGQQFTKCPLPTENSLVTTTFEGLRRALAKPMSKKEPITINILKAMVADTNNQLTLSNVWLTAAFLLAFAGVLCFN